MKRILIVDNDRTVRLSMGVMLRHCGFEPEAVDGAEAALASVRREAPSLILMDMNFSGATTGQDGLELLQRVRILCPETPVILMTAWGSIPLAVEGIRYGAFDFLTKPCSGPVLLQRIETALAMAEKGTSTAEKAFYRSAIVGRSAALTEILDTVRRIAPTDAPVLITGENGTGKELIAKAIHDNSRRRQGPFVMVNLGGISQSLFESEMFGHTKGAFTGAAGERKGRFELADKGTIFLDEIGDLDLNCQVKILRVLQQHTFEPLGDSRTRTVDIRVVCATNADLPAMLRERTFREDLFYRINAITLHLPPLRERREDIPLLINHFARLTETDRRPEFSSEAIAYLTRLPYPGNVRQLKNIVERSILMSEGAVISLDDIERDTRMGLSEPKPETASVNGMTLEEMERTAIENALKKHSGNITNAALELGITRQALYRKIEKYGLTTQTK